MKNLFAFLFFSSLCFFALPVGVNATLSNMTTEDSDAIDMGGDLKSNLLRSLISPIEAYLESDVIDVDFNSSLGIIDLTIYDEVGNVVYQQSVNTYAGQQLSIDISSFNQGQYTIEFVNSQGQYLSGDFTIL
jgi:hypothetical protein